MSIMLFSVLFCNFKFFPNHGQISCYKVIVGMEKQSKYIFPKINTDNKGI